MLASRGRKTSARRYSDSGTHAIAIWASGLSVPKSRVERTDGPCHVELRNCGPQLRREERVARALSAAADEALAAPLSRLAGLGREPDRATIGRRSSEPSSGSSAIEVQVIISRCRTRKRADPLSPPRRLIRVSDRRSKRPAWKVISPTPCVSLAMLLIRRLVARATRTLTFGGGADERPCRREVLSSRPAFAGVPA
jgi:hypothetical protein